MLTLFGLMLTSGCAQLPDNCSDLIKGLVQKSFEDAGENSYYIKKVNIVSTKACSGIRFGSLGVTMKQHDWIPCEFNYVVHEDGVLGSELDMWACINPAGCDRSSSGMRYWTDKRVKWTGWPIDQAPNYSYWIDASTGKKHRFFYKHSTIANNESNPKFYFSAEEDYLPRLIFKNSNSMQCKASATTSRDQEDQFFFTQSKWGSWSITPEHEGRVEIELQSTGMFNFGDSSSSE